MAEKVAFMESLRDKPLIIEQLKTTHEHCLGRYRTAEENGLGQVRKRNGIFRGQQRVSPGNPRYRISTPSSTT